MTANTEKIFNTGAQTRLASGISASAVACTIEDPPEQVFPSWATGKELYLTLVDPSANREIVKVTGASGKTLTIARGQGGTTARAWPIGSLMEQRPVAGDMSAFLQQETHRSITYNPNGVLTAAYPGEKVMQTGVESCQNRWWKNIDTNRWKLITGGACDWELWIGGWLKGIKYIGSDHDGTINVSNADWATARGAPAGANIDRAGGTYSPVVSAASIMANYQIARGFYSFDLADEDRSQTVVAAQLCFFASDDSSEAVNSKTIIAQKGTQDFAELQLTDFNKFEAPVFGTVTLGAWNPAVPSLMTLAFDATGIAYLNTIWGDQYLGICLREKDHDYDNVAPGASPNYGYFRLWFADHATYKPYLVVAVT